MSEMKSYVALQMVGSNARVVVQGTPEEDAATVIANACRQLGVPVRKELPPGVVLIDTASAWKFFAEAMRAAQSGEERA